MVRLSVLAALVAAIVAGALPASGTAAQVVFHAHDSFRDSFPDEICGIAGTSVVRGVDDFQVLADNMIRDMFEINQVFTASASGKAVTLHVAEQYSSNDAPIDNGDGTITFVETFKGLPEMLKLPGGGLLSRDAGVVTFTTTLNGVTGDLVSRTFAGEKGPHPDLDSGFAIFCDVLIPALT